MLEEIGNGYPAEADLTIYNVRILSPETGWQSRCGNLSVRDGRILACDTRRIRGKREFDGHGSVVMPGLINGHCHGDMTIARGMGDGLTLQEQNQAFADHNWFGAVLSRDDRYASRQLTYCEALLSGTTFICENMYWSLGLRSIEAMAETGIGGALAEDMRPDFRTSDEWHTADWLREFAAAARAAGLLPLAGSISEEDFEQNRLVRLHQLACRAGLSETRHFSETTWRIERIRHLFDCTPTRMLDEAGLLKDEQYPQILSHGVHLTEEDIQILAGRTAGIINTPVSEMKINDGLAPLAELLEAGVPVGLGTDGALWNNCNDLFREMRAAVFLGSLRAGPASIRPEDALNMGTISGATVFGLEKEIGSLAVGKRADFLVLDIHQPHFTPLLESEGYDNLASLIVFNASGRDVSDVFVQGRRVVRERRVTTLDLPALMDDVNERAAHWTKKLR